MGIDYDATFGFGIKIGSIQKETEMEERDEEDGIDRYEILEDLLEDSDYVFDQSGDGDYTGDENTWYVFVNDPLKDGYDLTEKAEKLKQFCKDKGIEIDGEVGIIGGTHMC